MTDAIATRLSMTAIISIILAGSVIYQDYRDSTGPEDGSSRPRYNFCIFGSMLPLLLFIQFPLRLSVFGFQNAAEFTSSVCFTIFLHICLYDTLLLPAILFLRRHISARVCAALWLLPNYLYINMYSCMQITRPLLIIPVSEQLALLLLLIWAAGFFGVMISHIISHLQFRRRICSRAVPVQDQDVMLLWEKETQRANLQKADFPLLISPDIRTPLSIGLFRATTCILLPDRSYTAQELSMIFRHEAIHISRLDVWTKFFLLFCTAMCWFNPLMRKAMSRCAEDLELSCDETVLLGAYGEERRQYAQLLLSAAGDSSGFSTCLSASAASMRYRLKSVMAEAPKKTGALLMGCISFIMLITCGHVTLAYGNSTGEEIVFRSEEPRLFQIRYITEMDDVTDSVPIPAQEFTCTDTDAFYAAISGLSMARLSETPSLTSNGRYLSITFHEPMGITDMVLCDRFVKVARYGEHSDQKIYYLPVETEREALKQTLEEVLIPLEE